MTDRQNRINRFPRLPKTYTFTAGVALGFVVSSMLHQSPRATVEADIFPDAIDERSHATIDSIDNPLTGLKLPLNGRIQDRIDFYMRAGRKQALAETYQRSGAFLPMILSIFAEYDLPPMFAYLPYLESRFLPNVRSSAGAVGLWQLMPSTARDYGLKLNRWVDERRDPEKATVAAAEHLRLLYSRLRDWNLVLGAYNGGLGNIRRALAGTHTRDFWKLEQLPPETYNFVPNFYAILHILSSPEKHGLKLPEPLPAMQYETIDLEATFSMEQLAALTNLSIAEIETYNPALIGKLAPSGGYKIKLPVGAKQTFLHQYSTTPTQQIRIVYTDYKVRKGDTIANLAKAYGTSVSAIKLDNNLVDSRLKAGQLLRIATFEFEPEDSKEIRETGVVDEERKQGTQELARQEFRHRAGKSRVSLEAVARYYAVSVDDLYGWNKHLRSPHLNAGEEALIYKPVDKVITHRTRRGDSLWDLSRRYQTSISDIRRWNNLRDSKIYPGDKLVVRLK